MKTELYISEGEVAFDFGETPIVTYSCLRPQPEPLQAVFATSLEEGWENDLLKAQLGPSITAFVSELGHLPGAKKISVHQCSVIFRFEYGNILVDFAKAALVKTYSTLYSLNYLRTPFSELMSRAAPSRS